jgi:hypothetical protein
MALTIRALVVPNTGARRRTQVTTGLLYNLLLEILNH